MHMLGMINVFANPGQKPPAPPISTPIRDGGKKHERTSQPLVEPRVMFSTPTRSPDYKKVKTEHALPASIQVHLLFWFTFSFGGLEK